MPSAKRSNASSSNAHAAKKRRTTKSSRSIWNGTDDWEQLVADSSLSTASISTRRPRPRGLQSLVKCATDASARGFRKLWEDRAGSTHNAYGDVVKGGVWKAGWGWVPDHLRVGVRDGVFRYWGSYLTSDMINDVFTVAPVLYLPAASLPILAKTTHLKPFRPKNELLPFITSLVLTHASSATDVAIAGLIHYMPNLEVINLKGCTLAADKTVSTIIKQCPHLKRLNLKATGVKEAGVKAILDRCAGQLEGFKVDDVRLNDVNGTFESLPFPHLTHLCLPGNILNGPNGELENRARRLGHNIAHATPKATPENSVFDWPTLSTAFPALTHLALPSLFLPPDTTIGLPFNSLTKISFGQGGPPIPIGPLVEVIASQAKSLKAIHLGHLLPQSQNFKLNAGVEDEFMRLGEALTACNDLRDFRLDCGNVGGTGDVRTDQAMAKFSTLLLEGLKSSWRMSLKHLSLNIPQAIEASVFLPTLSDVVSPALEILDLPSVTLPNPAEFADAISQFKQLRSLDLSGTTITDEGVFQILDHCPLLSRIDLTSCRGVQVQHRRNVFSAWEELRRAQQE